MQILASGPKLSNFKSIAMSCKSSVSSCRSTIVRWSMDVSWSTFALLKLERTTSWYCAWTELDRETISEFTSVHGPPLRTPKNKLKEIKKLFCYALFGDVLSF